MDNQTLSKKLKIGDSHKILILNAPPGFVENFSAGRGGSTVFTDNNSPVKLFDAVLLFVHNSEDLILYGDQAIKSVPQDGILWIAYPKQSSGIKTDLTRDKGWRFLDPYALRGVSNIAIDDTWSALRFKKDTDGKSHDQIMAEFKDRIKSPESKVVIVPADFQAALNDNTNALHIFNNFAYTHRKEYVRWIEEAKKQETRDNRILKAVERIGQNIKFS